MAPIDAGTPYYYFHPSPSFVPPNGDCFFTSLSILFHNHARAAFTLRQSLSAHYEDLCDSYKAEHGTEAPLDEIPGLASSEEVMNSNGKRLRVRSAREYAEAIGQEGVWAALTDSIAMAEVLEKSFGVLMRVGKDQLVRVEVNPPKELGGPTKEGRPLVVFDVAGSHFLVDKEDKGVKEWVDRIPEEVLRVREDEAWEVYETTSFRLRSV